MILGGVEGRGVQLGQEPGLTDPLGYVTDTHSVLRPRGWPASL